MRRSIVIILTIGALCGAVSANDLAPWMVSDRREMPEQMQAPCPSFPGIMYSSMTYNKGCIPWDLEFNNGGAMSGNTAGAYFQWYRYPEGSSAANAVACDWQTDYTTCTGFKPKTDEDNTRYYYFCKVTTTACPEGVRSGDFFVAIGSPTDPCPTFAGTNFSIIYGGGSYTSGQTVTIAATTNAYGGDHIYTWYHNGVALDPNDSRYTFEWGFNDQQNPAKLIISNVQPEDGGTYSVVMQDGTECFMYANPVRVLVDAPTCGPVPNLTVSKSAVCEGDAAATSVTNNTIAPGEAGEIVYMVKPDGSNPTTTAPGSWTTDMPGLYQFKYVVNNPNNPSCFRESKVVTIRVYGGGGTPTITPDVTLIKINGTIHFTTTGLQTGETGTITYQKDDGPAGQSIWPADAHTVYQPGTYVYTYTISNPNVPGCARTATCEVLVYQCEWGAPQWQQWYPSNPTVQVGTPIDLKPSKPTVNGMTCEFTYSLNGGDPVAIDPTRPFTPTAPGTYVFTYAYMHSDPRVTDCYNAITKTFIVESCGTTATLATNKTTLKVGETATLTYPSPESGETAKLSYTKDGGAAQTMTGTTFSPSAPGSYELTYAITTSCGTTNASVTINVYDCGPDATVTVSRTTVRPNDPITIAVSSPGADETATLTVSYNGGAPQTVNAGSWSTPDEGTYIFEYKISHAYIDCSRSDQVTVSVSDCGTAVLLSADKSVLTLGETVNLSASRGPDANETPSLSVSINGGAAQPISNPVLPMSYSPTAAGSYKVTYSLHNTLLDCETSNEVSFSVYECGPDASINTDKQSLRSGESVNLSLSAPGADETASLTYTINGGAPISLPTGEGWSGAFTPQGAGEYVFTYTITHPYIECTRTATATLKFYDCGTPADISADKTAIALGESVQLTLSAVGADNTSTLTYTLNGGAPQTLTGNTFTPAVAGTYVITYSVSHSVLPDCTSSDQESITVYECGPEISMEIPVSEIKIMRSVNLILSAPGADESATLTYAVNGGTPQSVSIGSSPVAFTPTELGDYVFTYTISHSYLSSCTRTATATLRVIEAELVFDDNNGTHIWSDVKNWWPAYNRLPTVADSAVIRKACTVDTDNAITYDLTFDGGSVSVDPKGALVVAHRLLRTANNSISVLSDATGNGALVLGPENTNIPASVRFYSSAVGMSDLYPVWQYMGSPMQEQLPVSSAYPRAMFFEWTNTPNKQYGGNWQRVDSLEGAVAPFTGYCMTQNNAKTYQLQGTLNDPAAKAIAIPYNDQGSYPGFAFVANSWVAPIDIASLQPADFGDADATVYIMNAGTYIEAVQQQGSASAGGTGSAAGQYNTIPVHAASYLPNALSVIPSMQGFFVHTTRPTTLNLDYNKTVYTPALSKVSTTPNRAPALSPQGGLSTLSVSGLLSIKVSGFGAEDEVCLLESRNFTRSFDNGWDGYKARSERSSVSMAVLTEDGPLAVAALPQMEGTEILFEGGNHKTYTVNVQSIRGIDSQLYLRDKEKDEYTELSEGATYTFKCGAAPRRFEIVRRNGSINGQEENEQEVQACKFIQDGIMYIRLGERLYNGTGQLISK